MYQTSFILRISQERWFHKLLTDALSTQDTPTLKFLGSKAGFGFDNTSAYYYEPASKQFFLMDCGEDVFDKLDALGFLQKEKVSHFFVAITHMHSDHVGSLGAFLMDCTQKKIPCHIYFPGSEILKDWLSSIDVKENETVKIFGQLEDAQPLTFGPVQLKPEPTTHTGKFLEYGYGIQISKNPEKWIYYSGDYNGKKPSLESLLAQISNGIYQELYLDVGTGSPVHLDVQHLKNTVDAVTLSFLLQRKIFLMHGDDSMQAICESLPQSGYGFRYVETVPSFHVKKMEDTLFLKENTLEIKTCGPYVLEQVALFTKSKTIQRVIFDFNALDTHQMKTMLRKSSLGNLLLYLYYKKMTLKNGKIDGLTLLCSQELKVLIKHYLSYMNVPLDWIIP
jgi:hypothetical protein